MHHPAEAGVPPHAPKIHVQVADETWTHLSADYASEVIVQMVDRQRDARRVLWTQGYAAALVAAGVPTDAAATAAGAAYVQYAEVTGA